LIDRYAGFLVDLDGTVHVGRKVLPGAAAAIARVRAAGRGVVFVTNDPTASRTQLAAMLVRGGIPAEPAHVVTASAALADHLRAAGPEAWPVRVCAGAQTVRELEDAEVPLAGPGERCASVVTGSDDDFGYADIREALRAVLGGARLYGLNPDATYPGPDGAEPGAGSTLAAVEYAAGTRGRTVGKPDPAMFAAAAAILGRHPGELAIVGDRLDADVGGGRAAGMDGILVETGTHRAADVGRIGAEPVAVLGALADLR
jgi:HAD superfamily hydrolase (TIGR01450 family)